MYNEAFSSFRLRAHRLPRSHPHRRFRLSLLRCPILAACPTWRPSPERTKKTLIVATAESPSADLSSCSTGGHLSLFPPCIVCPLCSGVCSSPSLLGVAVPSSRFARWLERPGLLSSLYPSELPVLPVRTKSLTAICSTPTCVGLSHRLVDAICFLCQITPTATRILFTCMDSLRVAAGELTIPWKQICIGETRR